MAIEGDELDLEDAIGAAMDELGGEPAEQQAPKKQASEDPFPKTEDLKAEKDEPVEYVREGRRFVRKNGKETDVGAADAPKEGEQTAPKETAPLWFKNEWGDWEKLNPDMRKAMMQREKDYAQGIEKHSTAAKAWEPVAKAIEPHLQQLAAAGYQSPQHYVGQLIEADKYLRTDPVQAVNWLISQYVGQGWDIRSLAQWMDQEGVQTQKADPVQQELAALKNKLAALEQQPVRQQQETINRTVSEWSKDKPHFAELERIMLGQIQADPDVRERFRVNPQATLDSLYEQASWAHPVIRERILADQRKAEVKRARDASLGTREQAHANGHARNTPKMSLEDELGSLIDGAV